MKNRVAVVGPRLRRLLIVLLFLFACLAINSVYLGAVTLIEELTEVHIQNFFYQWMFLVHLALGLLIILPTLVYGLIHFSNAHGHRNRRAVKAGYALFITALLLLISGLTLTRGLPLVELKNPSTRNFAYWIHVVTPFAIIWLYVLHRLAGKRIRWRAGGSVLLIAAGVSAVAIFVQSLDPREWNKSGPDSAEQYFFPSLARTTDGQFIQAESLMMDGYCRECHQDTHDSWQMSAHRFSSFNNPVYAFSVRKTREFLQARDGHVQGVRFCAGCHDPVPFFSGAMDQADFGSAGEKTAQAGITCSACHSITHINSTRGNADYTIEEPLHYPFTFSEHPSLQWINRTLIKAKPSFHKQTFLKPLHKSTEFCGSCHKVHLPEELNGYKWLRGQNHYDSFLLSGVSGHGIRSFYYPPKAEENCNGCHMELMASEDFGAAVNAQTGELSVHGHQFPAANTALPHFTSVPIEANKEQIKMLEGSLRVDLFGVREGGRIDGKLIAPIESGKVMLEPGKTYLLEVVIRTLKLGHHFTQGTADSNQVWVSLQAKGDEQLIGESGFLYGLENRVDPWAHFVNAYVIDRDGNKIDRRNPENIFTQLYNNQIPPGASDVVHYLITVPETVASEIEVDIALNYRKFDTTLMRYVEAEDFRANTLPITTIASSNTLFNNTTQDGGASAVEIEAWERWNDYGIGLFRKEQFRQAEEAFKKVESFGQGRGAVNLARIYLQEGRLDEAADALNRASQASVPADPWSVSYFTARVNLQNGFFDEAITAFRDLVGTQFPEARARGFDFSMDYRLLNELALALSERAKLERGKQAQNNAMKFRQEAVEWYQKTLQIDSENVAAHYGLAQLYDQLGDGELATHHRTLHSKYKVDDNAKDTAVQLARRRDAAADRAANKVVIYELKQKPLTHNQVGAL